MGGKRAIQILLKVKIMKDYKIYKGFNSILPNFIKFQKVTTKHKTMGTSTTIATIELIKQKKKAQ